MESTSSATSVPVQQGSGGIVNAFEQFDPTTTPTGDSALSKTQFLQQQVEQLANVMDQFQQQQKEDMVVLEKLIENMQDRVQEIYMWQQPFPHSNRSM